MRPIDTIETVNECDEASTNEFAIPDKEKDGGRGNLAQSTATC